jgi:hypothetical protein
MAFIFISATNEHRSILKVEADYSKIRIFGVIVKCPASHVEIMFSPITTGSLICLCSDCLVPRNDAIMC